MRLQLLHELVTMTSGGNQSAGSTLILTSKMPFGIGVVVVLGRCSANTVHHWRCLSHLPTRIDAPQDAAADLLECHPPGERADNSLRQS